METFPSDVRIVLTGFGETPMPSVARDDMERGPATQRRLNKRLLMNMPCTLIFESEDAIENFLDWYDNDINVVNFFNFRHPRTGQTKEGRFPNGSVGTITPLVAGFGVATTNVTIEYYR